MYSRMLLILTLICIVAYGAQSQVNEASITFTNPPKENGITFVRTNLVPVTVIDNGQEIVTWVSKHKSVPVNEWARSFCLTITDPKFKNGKIPSVDIEVTFQHEGNTAVDLMVDTVEGNKKVASGWGNKKGLQVLKCHIDNAFFGSRKHNSDPATLPVDGYDLRVNAMAADFHLRSVVIRQEDEAHVGDWSKYLMLKSLISTKGYVVTPGGSDTISASLTNSAAQSAEGVARWDILRGSGSLIKTVRQPLKLNKDANGIFTLPFDSTGLANGEYLIQFSVELGGKSYLQNERSIAVAGPEDLFLIVNDGKAISRGLEWVDNHAGLKESEVNSFKHWTLNGYFLSAPQGWWHSVRLNVTDAGFQNGKRSVCDLSVTYRSTSNAPVWIMADTERGGGQVTTGWGNNPNWQTASVQLDDARFSRFKSTVAADQMETDGCDIRLNCCNGEGEFRCIWIHGYDLENNPEFSRLLRYKGVDAGRARFIFTPGEKGLVKLKLKNLSKKPLPADFNLKLTDDLGKEIWNRTGKKAVTPRSDDAIPVDFETKGMKQGVYSLECSIGHVVQGKRVDDISTQTWLMISEQSKIAKSKPGDFLYGLDTGTNFSEKWLDWIDFMGADITRTPGIEATNTDEMVKSLAAYKKHGLQAGIMFDMLWDNDAAKLNQRIIEVAEQAKAFAQKFGTDYKYYELGNEPDLTFFYPGPIEEYTRAFMEVSRAIKSGSPQSVVMNGGLCFFGEDGFKRAARFVELVSPDSIDAFAYHGHGPGDTAERYAYERILGEATKWNKHKKPFIETESGVSAHTLPQLRMQARTSIQKLVYAQSVGLPIFYWFRLLILGGDGDYTNLKDEHEPRPVVLSYRTMVKALKGLHYVKALEVGADATAYLFAQPKGSKRALVVWSRQRGGGSRRIQLSAKVGSATKCNLIDMFGNITPLPDASSGIAIVPVEQDPYFLSWETIDTRDDVKLAASLIETDVVAQLARGEKSVLPITLHNPSGNAIQGEFKVEAGVGTPVKVGSEQISLNIPANGQKTINVAVEGLADPNSVEWPNRWAVFLNVPEKLVDISKITSIPEKLDTESDTIPAQYALLHNHQIDLAAMAGYVKEKTAALLMAEITVPAERTITIGSAGDWWEQWFVNGKSVFDTLESGNNGTMNMIEHPFKASLHAGKNILIARVLSGSGGWKMVSGGPDELASAQREAKGQSDRLVMTWKAKGKLLATEQVDVVWCHPIAKLNGIAWNAPGAEWDKQDPTGSFGQETVTNLFSQHPDSSMWWKGLNDLSGRLWLRQDAASLYIIVAVKDDVYKPAAADTIDNGDSLKVALASGNAPVIDLGVIDKGVYRKIDGKWSLLDPSKTAVKVDRIYGSEGITWYRVKLDRRLIPSDRVAINIQAMDNDTNVLKQVAPWFTPFDGAVRRVDLWYQASIK